MYICFCFSLGNSHFSIKVLQKKPKLCIGDYVRRKKLRLSLLNRFNSLVNVQHFDAQYSKTEIKKKTCSAQFFGTRATLRNILINQRNLIDINMFNTFPYIKHMHSFVNRLLKT